MSTALQEVMKRVLERLVASAIAYLPSLVAAATIFLGAVGIAGVVRWLLGKLIKAAAIDRFLRQSGLSSMLDRSGRLRATRLVAGAAYWSIILIGFLTALNAFDTNLSSRIVEAVVFLLPKLVTAAIILLAGAWLAQYLGRSMLIWACNEGIPHARRLSAAVRILIVFVSVVVAADHLDFSRGVFLAAFIMLLGGAVLAVSIAAGIAAHRGLVRHFTATFSAGDKPESSVWHHL